MSLEPIPFVAEVLRACSRPGDRVLDVGCGPALYRDVVAGEYVGLDISDEPYADGVPRLVDVRASAESIPLAEATFDLVFTLATLYAVTHPDRALREMGRVLRPGGRLLVFDYNRRAQRTLAGREGASRPCWTARGLRARIRAAGFERPRLLVPAAPQPSGIVRALRLADEELRGQWAVVTARRPPRWPA